MSWGCGLRTAGSHLPFLLENFRDGGVGGGGSLGSQAQKQKVKSDLLSVSGKRSTPRLTHRLRMTNGVTVHKLFHLLPRHPGLINHCKLSHNYTMLNTNRGDPRIHGVVTCGPEYSCSATPVHCLTQQRLFVLLSAEGSPSVCQVKGGLYVVCGRNADALLCSPGIDTVSLSGRCLETRAFFCPKKVSPLISPVQNSSSVQDLLKWKDTSEKKKKKSTHRIVNKDWCGVAPFLSLTEPPWRDSLTSLNLSFLI